MRSRLCSFSLLLNSIQSTVLFWFIRRSSMLYINWTRVEHILSILTYIIFMFDLCHCSLSHPIVEALRPKAFSASTRNRTLAGMQLPRWGTNCRIIVCLWGYSVSLMFPRNRLKETRFHCVICISDVDSWWRRTFRAMVVSRDDIGNLLKQATVFLFNVKLPFCKPRRIICKR